METKVEMFFGEPRFVRMGLQKWIREESPEILHVTQSENGKWMQRGTGGYNNGWVNEVNVTVTVIYRDAKKV